MEVEDVAGGVFDDDLRVLLALVLDHDERRLPLAGVLFADRLADLDVDVADLAVLLGEDGEAVRVPVGQLLAALDLFPGLDDQERAVGHLELFELAPLGVEHGDLAVALEHDQYGVAVGVAGGNLVALADLDLARDVGLDLVLEDVAAADAAGL